MIMNKVILIALFFYYQQCPCQILDTLEISGKCLYIKPMIDTIFGKRFASTEYGILSDKDTLRIIKRNDCVIDLKSGKMPIIAADGKTKVNWRNYKKKGWHRYVVIQLPFLKCYLYENIVYHVQLRKICWETEKDKFSVYSYHYCKYFGPNDCSKIILNQSKEPIRPNKGYSVEDPNLVEIDGHLYQIISVSPCDMERPRS